MRTIMMLLLLAVPIGCKQSEPAKSEPAKSEPAATEPSAGATATPPTGQPAAPPSTANAAPAAQAAAERCAKQCEVMRASFKSGNTPSMSWYIDRCEPLCTGEMTPRSDAEATMVKCWETKSADLDPLLDCEPAGE